MTDIPENALPTAENMGLPADIREKAIELAKLVDGHPGLGITIVFNSGLKPMSPAPVLTGGLHPREQLPFVLPALTALGLALGVGDECTCAACTARRAKAAAQRQLH